MAGWEEEKKRKKKKKMPNKEKKSVNSIRSMYDAWQNLKS